MKSISVYLSDNELKIFKFVKEEIEEEKELELSDSQLFKILLKKYYEYRL